ncbi:YdcF family protein [Methylomagnum sp.]
MHWSWLVTNLVAALLLPPLNLLLLGAVGYGQLRRHPRLGRAMTGLALLGLWLLCTPFVAQRLLATLEIPYAPMSGQEAEAIVILGGGLYPESVEYGGGATLNSRTLERVRYGAWLHRKIGKPILVTGGAPEGDEPEGRLMRAALESEFGVPVTWMEDRSGNTRENARFSAELLNAAGVRRIYLVSHVWHLPRAIREFERAGLVVVPAGTGYQPEGGSRLFDFIPNARALASSYYAFHEWIGLIWYKLTR